METAGYGLIETLRVREGRIPFLERHLARLAGSIAALGLPRPGQDPTVLMRRFAGTGDAGMGVTHPLPQAAPFEARRLEPGARPAPPRTAADGVAPPVRANQRCGSAARGVRRAGGRHGARAAASLPPRCDHRLRAASTVCR